MKIQITEAMKREECCAGHTILLCEQLKNNIKLVACGVFGILYTCAMMLIDMGLRRWPEKDDGLSGQFGLRLTLATSGILCAMYASSSIMLAHPWPVRSAIKVLLSFEVTRILTYSMDVFYMLTGKLDEHSLPLSTTISLMLAELPFGVLMYKRFVHLEKKKATTPAGSSAAAPPHSSNA